MKIAVNAWRLQGNLTGVGQYLLSILRQWNHAMVPSGVEIEVHSTQELPQGLPPNLKPVIDNSQSSLLVWENSHLGPRVKADVLFLPSYTRPLVSRSRTVITTHDATSAIHPEMFPAGQRWFYNPLYGWSARHATRVISDSEASRADIIRVWRAAPERVVAIPLAPADYFRPEPSAEERERTRRRFSKDGDPYFVFVGKISGRRNVPLLLEAFAKVRQAVPKHRLVLVTLNPHNVDLDSIVARLRLEEHVVFTGYVPHRQLDAIYAAADALVIPSIYETTSLPAIEAQACGTPVVCIDTAGMREVTGGASSRFERLDAELVARAMLAVAQDPDHRGRLSAEGLQNAAKFTWERTARETLHQLIEAGS